MNTPHIPTLTINQDDHPLTFTLERDIRGQLEWRLHWDPAFLADPQVVRHWLLQLGETSMTWFYQQYGVIGPDGKAVDFTTEAGQVLLANFTALQEQSKAALAAYQQLIAEASE